MYVSRREVNRNKVNQERRSISYLMSNQFQRSKQLNGPNLESIYGVKIRKNRDVQKISKPRNDLAKIRERMSRK